MIRIGVDLGGTKIEVVAIGPDGKEIVRRRVPTRRDDYGAIVEDIGALVEAVEAEAGSRAAGIGMGIPGALSPATGLVRNANTEVLIGKPLDRDLEARVGRPVRVDNDANCFALAEARAGAAQGYGVVLGLILGTGCGSGIVVDGRVHVGPNRIAGEWGHNPLPRPADDERPGPACFCGRMGCLETWISGTGVERDHMAATGEQLSAPEIAARAEAGDAAARATLARHLDRFGRALANTVNILDPDAIVIGGGLSHFEHLYRDLRGATIPHVFADTFETPILKNRLGDSAGVLGAAWLWPEA